MAMTPAIASPGRKNTAEKSPGAPSSLPFEGPEVDCAKTLSSIDCASAVNCASVSDFVAAVIFMAGEVAPAGDLTALLLSLAFVFEILRLAIV